MVSEALASLFFLPKAQLCRKPLGNRVFPLDPRLIMEDSQLAAAIIKNRQAGFLGVALPAVRRKNMVSQLQRFLKIPLLPFRRRKLKAVPVPLSLPFPWDRKARHPDQVPALPFHDRPKAKAVKPAGTTIRPDLSVKWKVGDKAKHAKWGIGTIVSVKGSGEEVELKIAFPGEGIKALMQKYAPITKI